MGNTWYACAKLLLSTANVHRKAFRERSSPTALNCRIRNVSEISSDDVHDTSVYDIGNDAAPQLLSIEERKVIRRQEFKARKVKAAALALSLNAGDILKCITRDTITPVAEEITWRGNPELLCSYTWQETTDRKNNVYVPGAPPKWTPPTFPHTLSLDRGFHCLDHNHGRSPEFPYTPMFCALKAMNPEARLDEVDIVADRNNLRNLLRFIQGKTTDPFRLDLQLVDNTLFLTRKDARFWQYSSGLSYGFNFERHFTQSAGGMPDATAHYRVIRYNMGKINIAVRFEADAYYEETSITDGVERLAVQASVVMDGGPRKLPKYRPKIEVIEKGHSVLSSSIAELKTCPHLENKSTGPAKWMDQLWFGRTSHFFMGVHEKGTGVFLRFRYTHVRDTMPDWEVQKQTDLQKLTALLVDIKAIVRDTEGPVRAAVLVREKEHGPIMIRAMKEKKPIIPLESLLRHWNTTELLPRVQASPNDGLLSPALVSHHSGGDGVRPLEERLAIAPDNKLMKVLSFNKRVSRRPVRNQRMSNARKATFAMEDRTLKLLSFLEPIETEADSNGTDARATAQTNLTNHTSQPQPFDGQKSLNFGDDKMDRIAMLSLAYSKAPVSSAVERTVSSFAMKDPENPPSTSNNTPLATKKMMDASDQLLPFDTENTIAFGAKQKAQDDLSISSAVASSSPDALAPYGMNCTESSSHRSLSSVIKKRNGGVSVVPTLGKSGSRIPKKRFGATK